MGVFSTKGRDWSKPFSGRSASYSLESFAPGLNGGVHKSQASLFGNSWLSLRPTLGGKEEIESPFHENWVVYACIRLLSQALGGVPLRVWRSRDPEADEVPETHQLVKLLRRPNRETSWAQFAAAGITHRKLCGEDFWFLFGADGEPLVPHGAPAKDRLGRPIIGSDGKPAPRDPGDLIEYPSALYAVAGSAVDDERDTLGRPVFWTYAARSGSVVPKFAPASIVHFRDYDPADPVRGIGDAEVAIRQISIQHQVERNQESNARSGGPGAFISLKRDIGTDERDRFQDEINAEIRSAEGGYKVLSGDATIIPNPATPDKMQNIELLRWSRDVICTLMGVPVQCIGASESQTYSNMKEAWAQLYNGLASYCRSVEDVINSSFLPRLKDREAQGFYVAFDFSEVEALQEDDSDRWIKAADMAARGVGLSFNAAAATLQLDHEPTPAGDVIFVPSGVQILNEDGTLPEPEPAPDMEPDEEAEEDDDAPAPKDEKGLELRLRHPALKTVEERAAYHKRFSIQILETGDRKLYRAVRHWFVAYEREQIARLREFAAKGVDGKRFKAALVERSRVTKDISDDVEVFLQVSREKWARLLGTATRDLLEDVYADALRDMARELGVPSIPMADIRVIEFLAEQQLQLTEGVSSTVAERVKSALVEALGEPATISDLQLAVREKLPDLTEELRRIFGSKDARALTIARTETGHAASGARFEQMKAVGIAKHQWISSRDAHVRESHEQLDGEIREIGQDFAPGLERPHDPDAPADQVVNCRCVALPVLED